MLDSQCIPRKTDVVSKTLIRHFQVEKVNVKKWTVTL